MLPDYLKPGLEIVFVGLNPGEYSDRVGHYFARPQNLFWPALNRSGLLPRPCKPEDDASLPEYGMGLTDIVARASAGIDTVAPAEFVEGGRALRARLEPLEPLVIAFVGVTGYRLAYDRKAQLGPQPMRWGKSHLFIIPSTSRRNAYYRPEEIYRWFVRLKEYRDQMKGVAR